MTLRRAFLAYNNISMNMLFRDPKIWPEPEKFDPERFLGNIKEYDLYTHIPFATGPHKCLGHQFVKMEMKHVLASLIREFKFKVVQAHTMGDFNAHTGTLSGHILAIHADILSNFQYDPQPTYHPPRKSRDIRTPDHYGRKLCQFCSDRSLTILNGCTPGDSQSHFTYEKSNTRSVIDYCATSPSLTPLVRNFQIGQHNSILSDHSILVTELNLQHTPHITSQSHSSPSPLLRFD